MINLPSDPFADFTELDHKDILPTILLALGVFFLIFGVGAALITLISLVQ